MATLESYIAKGWHVTEHACSTTHCDLHVVFCESAGTWAARLFVRPVGGALLLQNFGDHHVTPDAAKVVLDREAARIDEHFAGVHAICVLGAQLKGGKSRAVRASAAE